MNMNGYDVYNNPLANYLFTPMARVSRGKMMMKIPVAGMGVPHFQNFQGHA